MKLEVYKNPEFDSIRTALVNEQIYFVGKDVAESLGYSKKRGIINLKRLYGVLERLYGVLERLYGVLQRLYGVLQRLYGVLQRLYGVLQRLYGVLKNFLQILLSIDTTRLEACKKKLKNSQ